MRSSFATDQSGSSSFGQKKSFVSRSRRQTLSAAIRTVLSLGAIDSRVHSARAPGRFSAVLRPKPWTVSGTRRPACDPDPRSPRKWRRRRRRRRWERPPRRRTPLGAGPWRLSGPSTTPTRTAEPPRSPSGPRTATDPPSAPTTVSELVVTTDRGDPFVSAPWPWLLRLGVDPAKALARRAAPSPPPFLRLFFPRTWSRRLGALLKLPERSLNLVQNDDPTHRRGLCDEPQI